MNTCVFLLDNFDNSTPKDGVDHKVNVTHRHDWPNKNAVVPKSLSGKRKYFIFQPLWHKITRKQTKQDITIFSTEAFVFWIQKKNINVSVSINVSFSADYLSSTNGDLKISKILL